MAMNLPDGNPSFLQSDVGTLVVEPVTTEAAATQVSTVISTGAASYRIPLVSGDPSANWTAEGTEITPSDSTLGELVISFHKLAGLTIVSNELMADASPAAASIIGDGLARDIAAKLDTAFFASATADGPAGIKSLVTTTVAAGQASWINLDPFVEAIYAAANLGATIDSFVSNPADALLISKIKQATTSNINLLQPDPAVPGGRTIAGVRLLTDPAVTAGEVWAIPKDRSFVIIRDNATVEVDPSPFFSSDRTAIRATLRIGFGWVQPLAIVKITKTA